MTSTKSRKLRGGQVDLKAREQYKGKEACRVENEGGAHSLESSNSTFHEALGASQEFSRQVLIYASLRFPQIWQRVQNMDLSYNPVPHPPTQCVSSICDLSLNNVGRGDCILAFCLFVSWP